MLVHLSALFGHGADRALLIAFVYELPNIAFLDGHDQPHEGFGLIDRTRRQELLDWGTAGQQGKWWTRHLPTRAQSWNPIQVAAT